MSGCANDPTQITAPLTVLTIEELPSSIGVAQSVQLRLVGHDGVGNVVSPGPVI